MRRLASVVLTGVLLTACNGDPFSPEGVSGTYNLESINGNPLPELSIDGSLAMAGSITLNADGSMSFQSHGTTKQSPGLGRLPSWHRPPSGWTSRAKSRCLPRSTATD